MSTTTEKTRRSVWALIAKLLWAILRGVLKVLAALGSRWARGRLDKHRNKTQARTAAPITRRWGHRRGTR